jgi:S-formylglutathione hydrolase FrmB
MRQSFLTSICVSLLLLLAAAPAPVPVVPPLPQTDRWSTLPAKPQPLLVHKTFHSRVMDTDVGYNLYLPPGYDLPANKDTRYPVLYWLHGMNQTESTDHYPIHYLDDGIKAGVIPPMIVVYVSGGQRTYYTDSPDAHSYPETAFIDELIPTVDQTYRTQPTREHRAIAGMSMGGFGALKFAFKHPELFSSVTAFAPGIRDPQSFAKDRPDILARMFKSDPKVYEANHPATWLKKNLDKIRGKLPIAIYVGTKDYLKEGSIELDKEMADLKVKHTFVVFEGLTHNLGQYSAKTKQAPFVFAARGFK